MNIFRLFETTNNEHYILNCTAEIWENGNWIPGDVSISIINPDGFEAHFLPAREVNVYYKNPNKVVNDIGFKSEGFQLSQNYPNPFSVKGGSASGGNPATVINYQLREKGFVTLKVYDMLGNEVAVLVNEMKESGSYSSTFSANNLASGVYIYRINVTDVSRNIFSDTKRMLLIK